MLTLSRASVTAGLCLSCVTASLSVFPTARATYFPSFVMATSAASFHPPKVSTTNGKNTQPISSLLAITRLRNTISSQSVCLSLGSRITNLT